MLAITIDFLNLLLASLVAGTMFGVSLVFRPGGLDGPHYVELQQRGIRTLNRPMPVLGAATLLVTVIAAAMDGKGGLQLGLFAVAAAAFLAAGLITRFLNQPINTVVMSWSAAAPPDHWTELRDAWWRWHLMRLTCGIGGLCALILANLIGEGRI